MLKEDFTRVATALRSEGLLLGHDARLPSVTKLMIGPIHGSWWGHAEGSRIYALMNALEAEYLCVKLVRDKNTYVDTALLPVFLAAAEANEPWQTKGLGAEARALLESLRAQGRMVLGLSKTEGDAARAAARELQQRLLALAGSEHSESGAHYPTLETWTHFRRRTRCRATAGLSGAAARARIEAVVAGWGVVDPVKLLPWGRRDARSALKTP